MCLKFSLMLLLRPSALAQWLAKFPSTKELNYEHIMNNENVDVRVWNCNVIHSINFILFRSGVNLRRRGWDCAYNVFRTNERRRKKSIIWMNPHPVPVNLSINLFADVIQAPTLDRFTYDPSPGACVLRNAQKTEQKSPRLNFSCLLTIEICNSINKKWKIICQWPGDELQRACLQQH